MPPHPSLTHEIQHADGAYDQHRPDGRVWRHDAAGRLLDIVDADGAMTVFEENGVTLRFDARGDLAWATGGMTATAPFRRAA